MKKFIFLTMLSSLVSFDVKAYDVKIYSDIPETEAANYKLRISLKSNGEEKMASDFDLPTTWGETRKRAIHYMNPTGCAGVVELVLTLLSNGKPIADPQSITDVHNEANILVRTNHSITLAKDGSTPWHPTLAQD